MKTNKRYKKHNKTKKHNKNNKARGLAISKMSFNSRKSVKLPSIELPRNSIITKSVRMNSPQNTLIEYSLGLSEVYSKMRSPIPSEIPKCSIQNKENFPCKIRHTIFDNIEEYEEYLRLKKNRNLSTRGRSRREHYDNINSMLQITTDIGLSKPKPKSKSRIKR